MESDDGDDGDAPTSPPLKSTAGSKLARKTGGGQKRKAGDEELNGGGGKKRNGKMARKWGTEIEEDGYVHGASLAVKAEPRLDDSEGDYLD